MVSSDPYVSIQVFVYGQMLSGLSLASHSGASLEEVKEVVQEARLTLTRFDCEAASQDGRLGHAASALKQMLDEPSVDAVMARARLAFDSLRAASSELEVQEGQLALQSYGAVAFFLDHLHLGYVDPATRRAAVLNLMESGQLDGQAIAQALEEAGVDVDLPDQLPPSIEI